MKCYKKIYIVLQLFMCFMAVVFLNAIDWTRIQSAKRMILDIIIASFILLSPFALISIQKVVDVIELLKNSSIDFFVSYKKNIVVFAILAFVGNIILFLCGHSLLQWSGYKVKFWGVVFLLAVGLFCFQDFLSKKIHVFFFCSVLLVGMLYVSEYPSIVGICWDDEIHYARALKLVNAFDGINYEVDNKIILEHVENINAHNAYDLKSRAEYMNELEKLYDQKVITDNQLETLGNSFISYIPSAIGIVIARGLKLNFQHMFMLGKLFNLLAYIVLFTLAIRKTPYGKILMTIVGMIPTMIFMASSYSYDPWVLGWNMLGYAYFMRVICLEDNCNDRNLILAALCITIGCLPKAIYFPMLLPLLFVGKDKIENDKARKKAKVIVIICAAVLVGSFLLPMLINGAGTGDPRGGADVNATEQIKFILHNPLQYFKIWYEFIKMYVNAGTCVYLISFAYAGFGEFYGIVLTMLLAVGLLDRMDGVGKKTRIKGVAIVSVILILLLVPTALYISFSAVASPTINGCQYRYIIPIIFPALMFSFSDKVINKINHKVFTLAPSTIMIIVLLASLYTNITYML